MYYLHLCSILPGPVQICPRMTVTENNTDLWSQPHGYNLTLNYTTNTLLQVIHSSVDNILDAEQDINNVMENPNSNPNSNYVTSSTAAVTLSATDDTTSSATDTTSSTLETSTVDVWADTISRFDDSPISSTSLIAFSLAAILTAGSLLLLFAVRRRTLRYTSMIRMTILINIILTSISDIMVRVPAKADKDPREPIICVISHLLSDFWIILMILMLPLLCVESLLTKRSKWIVSERQKKNLIGSLLVAVYTFTVVFSCLPTMVVGRYDQKNRKCDGKIQYGHYFAYVFLFLSVIMLVIVVVSGLLIRSRLKERLTQNDISDKRKEKLKHRYHNTVSLTAMLCLGLIPHSITRQQTLFCGSRDLNVVTYCTDTLPFVFYRLSFLLLKSVYTFLPVMFLGLDPKLRSKYWISFGSPPEEVLCEDSVPTSSALVPVDGPPHRRLFEEDYETDPEVLALLAITDGRSNLDLNPQENLPSTSQIVRQRSRGRSAHNTLSFRKKRKRVSDNVDVLSMISERSESSRSSRSSRTSSERASFRANYTNQAFDWSALQAAGVTPSVPRSVIQPRLIRRTTSYSWIATLTNDAFIEDETDESDTRQHSRLALTDGTAETGNAVNTDIDDLD